MNIARIRPAAALIALTLCLVAACSAAPAPDLRRLYALRADAAADTRPLVIIPGILGSRLRDPVTKADLWPPQTIYSLLFERQQQLALRFDPKTLEVIPDGAEAYDLFEGALGRDFYGQILRTLEDSGGYVRGQLGIKADPHQRRYYVFPYDWRQDNVVTARKLDAFIEQIRRDYADPALKVDVVAHSMGGLITRYFLRYGTEDVLDGNDFPVNLRGAEKLHTVVLLGTPNLGSVSAVHRLLEGWSLGLRRIRPETLATMPSVYQLFPHPLNNWLVTAKGEMLNGDLFYAGLWRDFGWSVFDPEIEQAMKAEGMDTERLQAYFEKRLERARRFVWALTVKLPQTPVRLVVFGGDCELTPARLVVEDVGKDSIVRLWPDQIRHKEPGINYEELMLEPGDGSVTKASLLARQNLNPTAPRDESIFFPLAYSFFLCENHEHLTGNRNFQDNLLNVLLSGEQPWDQPAAMQKMMPP